LGRVELFTYRKQLDDAVNRYDQSMIDLEDILLGHGFALKDTTQAPDNILRMAKIRIGYNNSVSALTGMQRNLSRTIITAPISGVGGGQGKPGGGRYRHGPHNSDSPQPQLIIGRGDERPCIAKKRCARLPHNPQVSSVIPPKPQGCV
jgi:hypothetical protein